jgi:hypothetical protein
MFSPLGRENEFVGISTRSPMDLDRTLIARSSSLNCEYMFKSESNWTLIFQLLQEGSWAAT